jgi:hypothetical protein
MPAPRNGVDPQVRAIGTLPPADCVLLRRDTYGGRLRGHNDESPASAGLSVLLIGSDRQAGLVVTGKA